jgi:hypothetical protein
MFISYSAVSQSVAINDNGAVAHPSSMLDVNVTAAAKKGVLIPRMTSAERTAIAAPAKGLLVFDNNTSSFWYYNGAAWTQISSGASTNYWTLSGANIYNNNAGNVGVGVTNPLAKFNVGENRTVLFGKDTTTAGKKFIWYASKGALRFGTVDPLFSTTSWQYANVGVNSFAFGASTLATGPQSIATGVATSATSHYAWAHGFATSATGDHSMAVGQNTGAVGSSSFAFGPSARAYADFSHAIGNDNSTTGTFSTAFGLNSRAKSYASFVIGRYNDSVSTSSNTSWVVNDPLFIIGNGTNTSTRSNAMVVLKNAVTGIGANPVAASASYGMLQVKGLGNRHNLTLIHQTSASRWGFYVAGTGPDLYLYFNGIFKGRFDEINGAYIQASDRRFKKDIMPASTVLSKILQLKAYQYHYLDNRSNDPLTHGFMAQDVEAVFPEFVSRTIDQEGKEMLGLNYTQFSVLAIKAIQEQHDLIKRQEKIMRYQEDRIDDLEKRLLALEEKMK